MTDEHKEDSKPETHDSNAPGHVTVEENNIYFYVDIIDPTTQALTTHLHNLERKLLQQQIVWNLPEPPPIHLWLQSPGGYVSNSFALYDALRASRVPVTAHVTGEVASGGTLMLMGAQHRIMQPTAFMLIHELRGWYYGKMTALEQQMRNYRMLMKKIKEMYLRHTKMPKSVLSQLLKQDLYLTAKQCLRYGLVDEIG